MVHGDCYEIGETGGFTDGGLAVIKGSVLLPCLVSMLLSTYTHESLEVLNPTCIPFHFRGPRSGVDHAAGKGSKEMSWL